MTETKEFSIQDNVIAPSRWKLGLYIWRKNKEWRLRLYRPWREKKFIEAQSTSFLAALYVVGIGADWWEAVHE